jgi:hypothetical protein
MSAASVLQEIMNLKSKAAKDALLADHAVELEKVKHAWELAVSKAQHQVCCITNTVVV